MDETRSILIQISKLKDGLDKVNYEVEATIQSTREIESEIIKCDEVLDELSARESELTKLIYTSQFELHGLSTVTVNCRNSLKALMKEIDRWQRKKDELLERLSTERWGNVRVLLLNVGSPRLAHSIQNIFNREVFSEYCIQFQSSITCEECDEIWELLREKAALEDEIYKLEQTHRNLKNSVPAASEKFEVLQDVSDSYLAMGAEIQRKHAENEQLEKQIQDLRITLLSTVDDPW